MGLGIEPDMEADIWPDTGERRHQNGPTAEWGPRHGPDIGPPRGRARHRAAHRAEVGPAPCLPLGNMPAGRLPLGLGAVGGFELSCGRAMGGGLLGDPAAGARVQAGWSAACAGCALERWIDGSDGTLGFEPVVRLGWLARERTLFLAPSGSGVRPRSRIAPLIFSGSASFAGSTGTRSTSPACRRSP